jgi:hypothetical protein
MHQRREDVVKLGERTAHTIIRGRRESVLELVIGAQSLCARCDVQQLHYDLARRPRDGRQSTRKESRHGRWMLLLTPPPCRRTAVSFGWRLDGYVS